MTTTHLALVAHPVAVEFTMGGRVVPLRPHGLKLNRVLNPLIHRRQALMTLLDQSASRLHVVAEDPGRPLGVGKESLGIGRIGGSAQHFKLIDGCPEP